MNNSSVNAKQSPSIRTDINNASQKELGFSELVIIVYNSFFLFKFIRYILFTSFLQLKSLLFAHLSSQDRIGSVRLCITISFLGSFLYLFISRGNLGWQNKSCLNASDVKAIDGLSLK